jgi:hypothetical protein
MILVAFRYTAISKNKVKGRSNFERPFTLGLYQPKIGLAFKGRSLKAISSPPLKSLDPTISAS